MINFFIFDSCSNHFAQIMLRPFDDPKDDGIYVDSFSQIHTCTVSWQEDPCADLYILMRKEKMEVTLERYIEALKHNMKIQI